MIAIAHKVINALAVKVLYAFAFINTLWGILYLIIVGCWAVAYKHTVRYSFIAHTLELLFVDIVAAACCFGFFSFFLSLSSCFIHYFREIQYFIHEYFTWICIWMHWRLIMYVHFYWNHIDSSFHSGPLSLLKYYTTLHKLTCFFVVVAICSLLYTLHIIYNTYNIGVMYILYL